MDRPCAGKTEATQPQPAADHQPPAATCFCTLVGHLQRMLGRYLMVLLLLGVTMASFTLLRLVMMVAYCEPAELRAADVLQAFAVGLWYDLLVGLCLVLPQTIHLTVCGNRRVQGLTSQVLLELEWLAALLFLPLMAIVEFLFFHDFQSRLNYIAFEYLVYPHEVCCSIWQSYSLIPLVSTVLAVGSTAYIFLRRPLLRHLPVHVPWARRWGILGTACAAVVGLWLTISMESSHISGNRTVNECAGNGWYSFVYYAWTCRFDYEDYYLTLAPQEADRRICGQVAASKADFHKASGNPLDRTVDTGQPRRDLNVVIVLEESLGSDFIGALGRQPTLTPCFDDLTKQGTLFDNFYATGNRTARALEAVLTSMPPLPTESILKRDHSDHVYTLAHVLAGRGYQRLFMTGGRGLFDGVRSFMTRNGFDQFVEQSDFESPVFTNAWGVSDEDLFHRAVEELDRMHQKEQPFLAVILTVSNHRPYTYPEGRIAERGQTREKAVKYADWALGDFFARIRSHAFYRDTILVVMGDHGARVYGSQLFPMKSYRVPLLVITPDQTPKKPRCSTLACSLDLAPTVMGLLGGSYRSVFFGRDALKLKAGEGYALMQHNHDVALLDAHNNLTVLGSNKSVTSFRLDRDSFELEQLGTPDEQRTANAISFYQTANRMYYHDRCFPATDWAKVANRQSVRLPTSHAWH